MDLILGDATPRFKPENEPPYRAGEAAWSFSLPELTEARRKNSMRFVRSLARTLLGWSLLFSMHVVARDYRFDGFH